MKKTLLLFLLAFFALSVSAQKKCELPLNATPTLFNLKLGMNGNQVKQAVGGKLKIKNKKEGTFFQNFIKNSPPRNLSGIRAIYLRFFDSKLYQIEIFYEKQNERLTLEEFVRSFSVRENLQFEFWKIEYGIAELKCDGFSIEADNFLNPRIQLTDEIVSAEFEKSQVDK
jgi:hypothetical protein